MMLRQFLNPPNWFTAASMFCGLYSIVLATGVGGDQNFYRAGLMILFAGVFDTIDGSVARLTKTGSEFGVQLDSLVDVVSFGIAPAILLYASNKARRLAALARMSDRVAISGSAPVSRAL